MKGRLLTLLALILFIYSNGYSQEELLVTEIQFDVPSGDAGDANGDGARSSRWDEFVELYNNGTEVLDLSGYQLVEREGVPFFTFPINTLLQPSQFTVVFGGGDVDSFTNIPPNTLVFSVETVDAGSGFSNGLGKSNLSNAQDRVMLVNPLLADTLFEVHWGNVDSALSSKGFYLGGEYTISGDTITGAIGQSITRDINGTKWGIHTLVVNDPDKLFSPGENAEEQKITANIILTEVMFDVPADEAGDANGDGVRGSRSDEFVEIYNKGPIEGDLTGFQILDREGIVLYTFPDSTKLGIEQYAVVFGGVGSAGFSGITPEALVFAVNESDDNVGFDNGNGKSNFSNAGDAVLLVNSITGDTLAELYWGTASAQTSGAIYLDSPNTISGEAISGGIRESVTRKLDSELWDLHSVVSGDTLSLFSPGLDAPPLPYVNKGDLIITEILFDPPSDSIGDANGDQTRDSRSDEFIEFYNRGASAIDLSGYQILETNGIPIYTFPGGTTLNPEQFVVVFGNIRPTGLGANLSQDAIYLSVNAVDDNAGFDNGQGKSNLSQASDAVILVNPANSDTLVEVFWGEATALTGNAIYFGFPNTVSGLTISGSIDQSVTRKINSSKWDTHTYITKNETSYFSPGIDAPLTTDIKKSEGLPETYKLAQNYPNPFNPATNITFAIPNTEKVSLRIYDVLGREVATLVNKELGAGNYTFNWNASALASGIYFYKLNTASFSTVKKMMLLK
ncbi:MAG: lamin tail domain-containing protein [Melioribacteraceae bacterium]|nr:lamin tail domain-containing protein [Melioribacteraceae bacterium]MCF8262856.1 lamin tail domain-containing protein [Melioribacteraceae bacterium]MCF8430647.1 lamin tail domain-containing protein [Melioribacteraceae bacterium]